MSKTIKSTIEFLGIWERVHNPDFNYGEFATIRSKAGLNSYKINVMDYFSLNQVTAWKPL